LRSTGVGSFAFESVRRTGDVVGMAVSYSVDGASQVGNTTMTPTIWGTRQIELDFKPSPGNSTVSLIFHASLSGYLVRSPVLVETDSMLASLGIKYVVVGDWATNTIERLQDPAFQIKAQFGSMLIYEFSGSQ
jgi:hypothetical protein